MRTINNPAEFREGITKRLNHIIQDEENIEFEEFDSTTLLSESITDKPSTSSISKPLNNKSVDDIKSIMKSIKLPVWFLNLLV